MPSLPSPYSRTLLSRKAESHGQQKGENPEMNQQPPPEGPQGGGRPAPRPEDAGRALLAKSRDLLPVLRDKWGVAMQEGGAALQAQTNRPDWAQDGRGLEQQNRFESSLEDFHSTIDQMELNLKCALETTGQSQSSQRYMPLPLLSYQQYIGTAKQQVTFTAGVREMLRVAAQDIVDHQPAAQQS